MMKKSGTQRFIEYWNLNPLLFQYTLYNSQVAKEDAPYVIYDHLAQTSKADDNTNGYAESTYQLRVYGETAEQTDNLATSIDDELNWNTEFGICNFRNGRNDPRLEGTRDGNNVWVVQLTYTFQFEYEDDSAVLY